MRISVTHIQNNR